MSAAILGLFMPFIDRIPDVVLVGLLGIQVFLACFRINMDDLAKIKPGEFLGIYVVRFILAPVLIYFLIAPFFPEYKNALFLLALVPSGVTLPVVLGVCGGHVLTGLSAVVITSALAPFIIPFSFEVFTDADMALDTLGMFQTLCFVVFLPTALFFLVRLFRPSVIAPVKPYAGGIAILSMCLAIVIVIAKIKDTFLGNLDGVLIAAVLAFGFYLMFYAVAWIAFRNRVLDERLTYTLIFGNNNIMLALTLALLFFPRQEVVMLAFGEFAWISGVALFQIFLKNYRKRHGFAPL